MNFEDNSYKIVRSAVSRELVDFIYDYFLNRRRVARRLFDDRYKRKIDNNINLKEDFVILVP